MIPFYVDTIISNIPDNPGIDSTYINLNCKKMSFEPMKGDMVRYSKFADPLFVDRVEVVANDNIFSHFKLSCRLVTYESKTSFVPKEAILGGQWFYKVENGFE